MSIVSGVRFLFKGKPYEVVVKTVNKVHGIWTPCVVYKALYAEGSKVWGHIYVRTEGLDDEWEVFTDAIVNAANNKDLNLDNLGKY